MKEITEAILKNMPWAKLTAPMIPVILLDIYLGQYLMDLYEFNVLNNVINGFPANKDLFYFFIINTFIIAVYLFLSGYGIVMQEKINNIRITTELQIAE